MFIFALALAATGNALAAKRVAKPPAPEAVQAAWKELEDAIASEAPRLPGTVAMPAFPDMPKTDAGQEPEPANLGGASVVVPATFTFAKDVTLAGDRLLLGQMAQCAGSEVICSEAYAVDLGPAPQPGRALHLSKAKLGELLAREWDANTFHIVAPASVKIEAPAAEIEGGGVADQLAAFVEEQFRPKDRFRLTIDRFQFAYAPRVRPGDVIVTFPQLADIASQSDEWLVKHCTGTQRIPIAFLKDGETQTVADALGIVSLSLKKRLLVAKKDLPRGHVIEASDLEEEWLPFARPQLGAAYSRENVVGMRLKRPVLVGAAVMSSQLEAPIVVKKGQIVQLLLSKGRLGINAQVKALGAGAAGQAIDAVFPSTKKKLRVRIVDSATVEYLR